MPQPLMSLEILIALLVGMVAIGAFMMAARRRLISWGSLLLAVDYRSSPGKRLRMGLLRSALAAQRLDRLLRIPRLDFRPRDGARRIHGPAFLDRSHAARSGSPPVLT